MQPHEQQGQPPLPPYGSPDASSSGQAWPHEQQQMPGMPPLPPQAQTTVPEGWQHGGWAQPAEAWGFAQTPSWGPQPPSMAGGYAIAGQMGPQAMQYYAVQQSAAAQGMPLQQHQGGVIFLCDPRTEKECLQRGLFGLPATQTQIVRAIVPEATLLFLFNVRAPSPLCACTRLAQFYFLRLPEAAANASCLYSSGCTGRRPAILFYCEALAARVPCHDLAV